MLESIGYRVIAAETPSIAIKLGCDPQQDFDCVLSDVIMPEMDGVALKDKMHLLCPELRFVFMSGYTPDIIEEHLRTTDNIPVLNKPLNLRQLHETLHQQIRLKGENSAANTNY